MKILIIVNRFKKSGPLNVVSNLIKNLEGNVIYLVSLEQEVDPLFWEYGLKKYCEDIISLDMSKNKYIFPKRTLNKILELVGMPDIIHTHGFAPDILIARNSSYKNHVSTIHNNMFKDYKMRYGLIGNIMSQIHSRYLRKITSPILCSGALVEEYKEHKIKLGYIDNGVSSDFFKSKEFNKNKIPIFNSIGHLSEIKNPQLIFNVFNKENKKEYTLYFIGDGPLRILEKSKSSDNINFIGYTNNVKKYLEKSTYFISASITEGMPNAALEALAMGNNLILSNIGAHTYLKRKFPKYVTIFDNEYELENIIESILNKSIYPTYINIEEIYEYFSAEKMSDKYTEIYKDVITKG